MLDSMSVILDAPCPELHVLVLDDDPVVRLAHTEMVRTLEPCARVTAVASVAEAIGAVEQFSGSQPVRVPPPLPLLPYPFPAPPPRLPL